MSDFHDIRFPIDLSFGASGGPVRPTTILPLASGGEYRNAAHRYSKRQYNAGAGLKSRQEAIEITEFYELRLGPLHGFRFRDPLDYDTALPGQTIEATDVIIGIGDGETTRFQLVKIYGDAAHHYERPITKPVDGTVLIAVNFITETAVAINYLSGVVTFDTPPAMGSFVTAGFEFDVPVRFASDALNISLNDFGSTQIDDIPLVEILHSGSDT